MSNIYISHIEPIKDIANYIRSYNSTTGTYTVNEMAKELLSMYRSYIMPYEFLNTDCRSISNAYSAEHICNIKQGGFCSGHVMDGSLVSFPKCKVVEKSAFKYCTDIQKVHMPMCSEIQADAFKGVSGLSAFGYGITLFSDNVSIDNSAFYSCENLGNIDLTNVSYIGNKAFGNCHSINTIDFPASIDYYVASDIFYDASISTINCDTVNTDGYNYFVGASIKVLSFPEAVDFSVDMLNGISNLNSVYLPKCQALSYALRDTYSEINTYVCGATTENISEAYFTNNSYLMDVTLLSYSSARVSEFSGCTNLISVSFPVCTYIDSYAFNNDTLLSYVNVPKCIFIGSYAFSGCLSISSLSFPDCTDVMSGAFKGCTGITDLYLPVCTNSTILTEYAGAFNRLNKVTLSVADFSFGTSMFSEFYYNVSDITLMSATTVSASAFKNCYNLEHVSMPRCRLISNYAFLNCTKLIESPIYNATTIGAHAFEGCINYAKLSKFELTNCKMIYNNAFLSFNSIETLIAPELTVMVPSSAAVSSWEIGWESSPFTSVTIGSAVSFGNTEIPAAPYFKPAQYLNCTTLTTFPFSASTSAMESLSTVVCSNCESILSSAFYHMKSLTNASFPKCKFIDYMGFYDCEKLQSAVFNTCTTMGSYAFRSCSALVTAEFESCESFGDAVFMDCTSLTSVSIPSCKKVQDNMFYNCKGLTSIVLESGCSAIGVNAFNGCENLSNIKLVRKSIVSGANGMLSGTPFAAAGCKGFIYVPEAFVSGYKTAMYWSEFSSYISKY